MLMVDVEDGSERSVRDKSPEEQNCLDKHPDGQGRFVADADEPKLITFLGTFDRIPVIDTYKVSAMSQSDMSGTHRRSGGCTPLTPSPTVGPRRQPRPTGTLAHFQCAHRV